MKKIVALPILIAALAVASSASAGDAPGWKVRCSAPGYCEIYWG